VHSSASRYSKTASEIRLDERWRHELSADQIARIEAGMRRVPVLRERLGSPG